MQNRDKTSIVDSTLNPLPSASLVDTEKHLTIDAAPPWRETYWTRVQDAAHDPRTTRSLLLSSLNNDSNMM